MFEGVLAAMLAAAREGSVGGAVVRGGAVASGPPPAHAATELGSVAAWLRLILEPVQTYRRG
ncbi:MAG: hypothetical protein AB8G23_12800 [Myxococcota bacterium]